MMQPLVSAMRESFGAEAVIDLVCMARCSEAAELLNGLDQVHLVQRGTGEVLEALRSRSFDYLMDFHGNVRSRSLARSLDVLTFSVDKQAWNRLCLIQGWRKRPVSSFIDRCFDVLKPFDISLPEPSAWGPNAWGELQLRLPQPIDGDASQSGAVVIGLGSSHPGKHLSNEIVEATIDVAQRFGRKVIMVGGADEQSRAEEFAKSHDHVQTRAGQWTLLESARAIAQAVAIVSGDTVTMHLAAATGTPVAAIWGCTRPSLGLAAWRPNPKSIDLTPASNRRIAPCSKHGATCRHTRSSDPFHPDRCGQHVPTESLTDWLQDLLS